jgi:hypothetical protein
MAKMRDGAQWLSNHYAANDYYCEGEHVVGSWAGKGAEFFGIIGQQSSRKTKRSCGSSQGKHQKARSSSLTSQKLSVTTSNARRRSPSRSWQDLAMMSGY